MRATAAAVLLAAALALYGALAVEGGPGPAQTRDVEESGTGKGVVDEEVPGRKVEGGARALEESRKKRKQQDLMSRILPMMVIPFMVQTAMIPMVLSSLKFMLLKSAFIGKMAIILLILNALRRSQNGGAVYSHNVNLRDTEQLHKMHYGYNGGPEYGAWINR